MAISQYLSVTAVLSQCWCFYNFSCFKRKILGFPFPTVLCCIFRVRVTIQYSTKFNLGSLVQLCQVTALFSSSWHFGIPVLFPIPCWDLLLYTHTCPFSFRTLMSDRSLHVERLQDGDIPPWVSFTINIVPPWVGKWGWDSVVCDWLIFFFFLLVLCEAPAAGRHWLLHKLFVFEDCEDLVLVVHELLSTVFIQLPKQALK